MLKLEYPAIKYYIGTAKEVTHLRQNLVKRNLAFPDGIEDIDMDFCNGNLYALAVKKQDDELSCWKKGECFIIDETDVAYLMLGELEAKGKTERRIAV